VGSILAQRSVEGKQGVVEIIEKNCEAKDLFFRVLRTNSRSVLS